MDPSRVDKRTKEYKEWAAKKVAAEEAAVDAGAKIAGAETDPTQVKVVTATAEPAADVLVEAVPEKKAPTRPWERKSLSRPWRRDYFSLVKKRPGFRCRFVDPRNVEARIQRGYQVCNPDHYGGLMDNDIRDSEGIGKVITRHGMVLMEIPEEGAKEYEKQQEDLIRARYRSSKQELQRTAAEAGIPVTVREEGF